MQYYRNLLAFVIVTATTFVVALAPVAAERAERSGGAQSASTEGSPSGSVDWMTFRNKRRQVLSLISTYGCKSRDPLHDVRLTASALEVTGLVAYGTGDYRSGHYLIPFDDVKAIDTRVLNRPALCSEWDDSVRIRLKSGQPNKYLWILLTTPDAASQFTDDLNWIVSHSAGITAEASIRATQFKEQASAWQSAATKPAMPETGHEHKVLAENAYREKNLIKAVDEYEAALAVFPTWPEGQFNVALICSESGDYDCAVEHMQDYLELLPNAPDAEAAKDKLIIWKDKLAQAAQPDSQAQPSKR
jgi:tetratricopeptide (TPR) repeat protein